MEEEKERCEPERKFYNSLEDNRENALISDNVSDRSFRSVNDRRMTLPTPRRQTESDLVQRFRTNLQLR